MGVAVGARIGGALLCILPCAAALTEEPELVLGGDDLRNAPVARKVTLGNNLFVNGYAVIGPDNCLSPGTTQCYRGSFYRRWHGCSHANLGSSHCA
jgi:hypothetical protein